MCILLDILGISTREAESAFIRDGEYTLDSEGYYATINGKKVDHIPNMYFLVD